jgi:predicted peptidase
MNAQMFVRSMLVVLMLTCTARTAEYESHVFDGPDGKKQPYRLLKPEHYEKGKRYPLVVLLHGFGERGTDNDKPIKSESSGALLFLKPNVRERFPCFVLVPQAPGAWVSEPDFNVNTPFREHPKNAILLADLTIQALMKKFPVDSDRIYIMGFSNGGCGTWDLLVRAPKLFAAAVVISGAGDPTRVAVARHVPIWVLHGAKDKTVPVARSHDMVAALKKSGGHPLYTEFPTAGHVDAAAKAHHEPDLLPWIFAQERGKPAVDISALESKTSSPSTSKALKREKADE